jgi:hypothetical protein
MCRLDGCDRADLLRRGRSLMHPPIIVRTPDGRPDFDVSERPWNASHKVVWAEGRGLRVHEGGHHAQ